MAVPAKQDIKIMRGDTEIINIQLTEDGTTPIDISGRTYASQIRYTRDAATAAASFSCAIDNAAQGRIKLTLDATSSSLLTSGTAFWDFQETNDGVVTTIIAGKCTILADVTRV